MMKEVGKLGLSHLKWLVLRLYLTWKNPITLYCAHLTQPQLQILVIGGCMLVANKSFLFSNCWKGRHFWICSLIWGYKVSVLKMLRCDRVIWTGERNFGRIILLHERWLRVIVLWNLALELIVSIWAVKMMISFFYRPKMHWKLENGVRKHLLRSSCLR